MPDALPDAPHHPAPPPPAGVRAALRDATAEIHRQLHHHPVLRPLTGAGLDRAAYRAALVAFHGVFAALEPRLPDTGTPRRPRTPLIRADLGALGLTAAEIAALPLAEDLPDLPDRPAALGCRYVLDGAAHGGRAMLPNLERRLGFVPGAGADFFGSAGFDAPTEWAALSVALDRDLGTPAARERAVAASVATFAAFARWLDRLHGRS
jgi:heme oxygenase